MKLTKLSLAMASVMGAGLAADALALDLYVDNKTQQIFAEPGPGRSKLGSFEKVGDSTAQKAEIEQIKQDLALKDNQLKALDEHMKVAEEYKVKVDKNGLQAESADKAFKFKLGGRIHADASFAGDDDLVDSKGKYKESSDGTAIRRARMRFEGVFDKDWLFRTEADFANENVAMKDVFIEYNGWSGGRLTVGQQKQNFSRELQESSNDMMFMERSLMDVLNAPVVDRAIGLNYDTSGKNWVAKLGVFGDALTPERTSDTENGTAGDEGWSASSRLIYNPIIEKDKLIHLGVAGNFRTPDDNGDVAKSKQLDYAYKTTSNQSNLTLLESKVTDVENIKMLGLEAAGMYGPFSIGGEYTNTWIERKDGSQDLRLDGWYAEAAWSITGESRTYKEGNFRYLKPAKKFSLKSGGWGAWEIAGRWSEVDLTNITDDKGKPTGGQMSQLTLALNWYINENIRFMADYNHNFDFVRPKYVHKDGSEPDDMNVFMMRGQVAF